jgi:Tfp pilus assembly protein PilF
MMMLAPLLIVVALAATACSDKPATTPAQTAGQLITQGLKEGTAGNTQQALTDFQKAASEDPTDTYAYYDEGVIYQTKLSETSEAAAAYQKALLANSTYKPALFNLAIIDTMTDPTEAISLYQQILMANPSDANTLFNLGLILIGQNQPVPGHADLSKAIMLEPTLASRVPKGITP